MTAQPAPAGRSGRRRWVVGGILLAGTVTTALGIWALGRERSETASVECPQLEPLVGRWSFTTEVVGARALDKLDMQGFYDLVVEREGCTATATITKHGFTGQNFGEARKQHAEARLDASAFSFGHGATFELRDASGRGPDQEFVFIVEGGRLHGLWRQRGSRWEKSGLFGFLEGEAGADAPPSIVDIRRQSCDVRCAIACDALRRDDAGSSELAACRSTCAVSSEVVSCGEQRSLPEALRLPLTGPETSWEALCEGLPCRLDPRLGRRRAPAVKPKTLEGGRLEVHLAELGEEAAARHHLAVRTEAGWTLSAPLIPEGRATDTRISDLRMYERAIGRGDERRVVGTFRADPGAPAHTFACRPDAPAPRCVVVPAGFEPVSGRPAVRVSPLPEDTLAIETEDEILLFEW